MSNRIFSNLVRIVIGVAMLSAIECVHATPSGLGDLPTDVKIPVVNGKALPVELIPHLTNKRAIYVKPLTGKFISQGVVKSPLADCELVRENLKINQINAETVKRLTEALQRLQKEYDDKRRELNEITRKYEELRAQLEVFEDKVKQATERKDEVVQERLKVEREIGSIKDAVMLEKDEAKLAELRQQRETLEKESERLKREYVKASSELRKAQERRDSYKLATKKSEGQKKGLEQTHSVQMEEITKIMDQIRSLEKYAQEVFDRFSKTEGAYTTFTSEFAPADYIQKLKEANPAYQFQYIQPVTATVDVTIPMNVRPGSPLQQYIGTMILDATWSNPAQARTNLPFNRYLLNLKPEELTKLDYVPKDPVKMSQEKLSQAQFEAGLTGSKFLALKLSVIGYCALKEPHALESQFINGAADTFKLAVYYTYPLYFEANITGRYNSHEILHDFYRATQESSWFGLDTESKIEHLRSFKSEKYMHVEVKPLGPALTFEQSAAFADKIREQLLFFSVQNYLDQKGMNQPNINFASDGGQLGARTVGYRLMLVPNPYAFWTGVVLESLAELFGSSTQTVIQDFIQSGRVDLDYKLGFTFMMPGDLTIGDLTNAQVKSAAK